jgi:hypothetical protein
MYAHLLTLVMERIEETMLDDAHRKVLVYAFCDAQRSPFCDAVICIMHACEIIIEDKQLGRNPPRPLVETVATKCTWLVHALAAAGSHPGAAPVQEATPAANAETALIQQTLL